MVQARNSYVGVRKGYVKEVATKKIVPVMINGKIIHVKQNISGQRQRSAWALKRLVKGWTQADCSGLSMLSRFKLEVFTCSK